MSMRITSGRSSRARATASSPSAASPTTSRPSGVSRNSRNPIRTSSWSSAISTRMLMRQHSRGARQPRGTRGRRAAPPRASRRVGRRARACQRIRVRAARRRAQAGPRRRSPLPRCRRPHIARSLSVNVSVGAPVVVEDRLWGVVQAGWSGGSRRGLRPRSGWLGSPSCSRNQGQAHRRAGAAIAGRIVTTESPGRGQRGDSTGRRTLAPQLADVSAASGRRWPVAVVYKSRFSTSATGRRGPERGGGRC
jgi:hypothetical protein